MYKLSLIIFLLLFLENNATSMCSVRKSNNSCICKHVTNINTIISEADCSRINLDKFPSQDLFPNDLNLLDLKHNKLSTLENNFKSYTLEILLLSYNQISYISDNVFSGTSKLKKLDLSHNKLTALDSENLFQNCKNLQYLDLSFNNIQTLHANLLLPLTQLQILDLSYNNKSLGEVISQNSNFLITNLNLNPNITSLKLNNLGLKDLHNLYFVNLTNLKDLSLADNHFEEIPRVPYSVQYLDISGSDITDLQAKDLSYHSLKVLKLNRMQKLEQIHHYAFYNLENLEELSIKNCRNLKEFNELIFGVLHKNMVFNLKRVSLSGNSLQSLNSTYKHLVRMLDFIDLTDNPWKCNCDLLWLQEFDNLYKSDYMICSSPAIVATKKFIDLSEKDIPMCYPQKYGKKSHRVLISVLSLFVILLSVLVGYLIYYAPSWYNRSRRLGPESPYNNPRVEES